MKKICLIFGGILAIAGNAYAVTSTVTSKDYVDTRYLAQMHLHRVQPSSHIQIPPAQLAKGEFVMTPMKMIVILGIW